MNTDKQPQDIFGFKNIQLFEADLDNLIFHGTVKEFKDFLNYADKCIETIQKSDNIRQIVLEAWLFIDYNVRQILISLIDSSKINMPEYDMRYSALPNSFERAVDLLFKIRKTNTQFESDPELERISYRTKFLFYIKKYHKRFYATLMKIEKKYYKKYFPYLLKDDKSLNLNKDIYNVNLTDSNDNLKRYSRVSELWLKETKGIDAKWVKMAKRLNSARNHATHSFDQNLIAQSLGFKGKNIIKHVKKDCIYMITKLTGIHLKI